MDPMTIHSVFCGECGGWEVPRFEQITMHEGRIACTSCGMGLLLVRTVEVVIHNDDE